MGRLEAVWTSVTSAASCPIRSHWAPTVCIQLPMSATNWAIHSARMTRAASAAQAESGFEGCVGVERCAGLIPVHAE
ncbi:hypothetical protein [Streptomyces sp. NPDC002922]|uniref:hypothetical protein n=1 Tax=Streptomyces sp. NPDC002922 TaxID=3154439 RepID=UPI0033B3124E